MPDGIPPKKDQLPSPLSDFGVPQDQLCYQALADITMLVDAWKKLDVKKQPHLKATREKVLKMWEERPEIHGPKQDPSVFHSHTDLLDLLVTIKFAPDDLANPDALLTLVVPGTSETIWMSPAMRHVALEINKEEHREGLKFRNCAGALILIYRLYGQKLDLSNLPIPKPKGLSEIMRYQPDGAAPRFFKIRIDNEIYSTQSWSVKMAVDGKLPKLDQDGVNKLLANPFDTDHIMSIVDTKKLMFTGAMFLWGEEVTLQHQHNQFQERLSHRNALRRTKDLISLQDYIRTMTQIKDLEMGLLMSPFEKGSRQAVWRPHLNSIRFSDAVDPDTLSKTDTYFQAYEEPVVFNALSEVSFLEELKENGYESLMLIPLSHHGETFGIMEFASKQKHVFDYSTFAQVGGMRKHISTALKHIADGEQERIMAVIKQTCTAIHPSVEWRFRQMARNYLKQMENDQARHPEPVVFKQVVPLFGVSDIRSSSRIRNESIQADLEHQLRLAADVISTAEATHSRPVFDELGFRINQHQNKISKGLKSGDETRIYAFLRYVVESAFDELASLSPSIRKKVNAYRKELDPEVGVIYQVRKSYDDSVTQINDTLGAYIDYQQEIAQKMIPHYFEKFKTDGVDHNIYVGDALLETGTCSPLDLRNLYLWQLMCMCGVVWIARDLKPKLSTPLDTAHLILAQSAPLNITFQMEEKHFSVDGAYNARYEIVKKRIDKAKILETGERLTQPDQIAIVYTQESELSMYREFISYLQRLGYLKEDYLDAVLEDLQGVHGLRALRVSVAEKPPAAWTTKTGHARLGAAKSEQSK